MKTLTTLKAIVAVVLCYFTTITFSSFLVETVYAHSAGSVAGTDSNNHDHRRVVSVSELLLQVTPFTAGLAIGFALLFWKNEIIDKFRLNKNPRT
jgi:hypothetical protein